MKNFIKGNKINSIAEFDSSTSTWYAVKINNKEQLRNREVLIMWQYSIIKNLIESGCIFEVEKEVN